MKPLLILFILLPVLGLCQKLKVNEYDRFIKQRRIELEPVRIFSSEKATVSLSYKALGSALYAEFSGFGWGAFAIDAGQEMILLFSNDSILKINSTEVQISEVNTSYQNTYKHSYFIKVPDIKLMSEYEVVGIRKYGLGDHVDLKVSRDNALKIKRLSTMFLEELKIANLTRDLQDINISDISKHIGDSVRFCAKVYNTRYFESAVNKPTILDLSDSYASQLNIVIWGQDRKNFPGAPESLYYKKEVCVSGVVETYNNMPRIVIRNRNQITLKTSADGSDVAKVVGDSVTASEKAGKETVSVESGSSKVKNAVIKPARFPGGHEALLEFLKDNLVCPQDELPVGEKKVVVANFLINPDGSASNIKITQAGGKDFDQEVIRVIKLMPKWEPQISNGTAVAVTVTQPITFVRQKSNSN